MSSSTQTTWPACFSSPSFQEQLQNELLPAYLRHCRWFAGKARKIKQIRVKEALPFVYEQQTAYILLVDAFYRTGKLEQYLLPLTYVNTPPEAPERSVIAPWQQGHLIDAIYDAGFRKAIYLALCAEQVYEIGPYRLHFERGAVLNQPAHELPSSQVMPFDQSNTSLFYGERYFLKFYRKLFALTNPELELVRFLSEKTSFRNIPVYAGSLGLRKGRGQEMTLAILQQKVSAEGDAWKYVQQQLADIISSKGLAQLQEVGGRGDFLREHDRTQLAVLASQLLPADFVRQMALLGQRTADMHNALASVSTEEAFAPAPFDATYTVWLSAHFDKLLEKRQQLLAEVLPRLAAETREPARWFSDHLPQIRAQFEQLHQLEPHSLRTRIHGDYHLGQVLCQAGDFIILDFEGEPESSISDRKIKHSPLKDVAGMLRSFHYAAYVALYFGQSLASTSAAAPAAEQLAESWYQLVGAVYLQAYFKRLHTQALRLDQNTEAEALLRLHLLEKAVYEFGYELNGRPDWAIIPLKGIRRIIDQHQTSSTW
jgi:trehalose synthase-fused probable maltokinase